jgi:hypothetical protein
MPLFACKLPLSAREGRRADYPSIRADSGGFSEPFPTGAPMGWTVRFPRRKFIVRPLGETSILGDATDLERGSSTVVRPRHRSGRPSSERSGARSWRRRPRSRVEARRRRGDHDLLRWPARRRRAPEPSEEQRQSAVWRRPMRDEILALLPRPSAALDRGAQRSGVWDSNPRPSYRREIYLHISGPTWGDVVPCSVRHSLSQPRDLHAFASKSARRRATWRPPWPSGSPEPSSRGSGYGATALRK